MSRYHESNRLFNSISIGYKFIKKDLFYQKKYSGFESLGMLDVDKTGGGAEYVPEDEVQS